MKTIIAFLLTIIVGAAFAGQPVRFGAGAWSGGDLTRPLGKEEAPQLLEDWRWLVGVDHKPIIITAMGDAFVLNGKSGAISFLDTVEGKLKAIAPSLDSFYKRLNKDQGFVDEYFSTHLLKEARARGLSLGAHQVYSYKQPPVLGGAQAADNIEASDLAVHFSMLGQIFQQVHNLPPGTKIKKIELR